jgi:hypothetical protein
MGKPKSYKWGYGDRFPLLLLNYNFCLLGACRNSIFLFFLPFLAKKVVPDSRFSDARFFQCRLFDFLQKIWNGWRPAIPDFLAFQIQISKFPDFFPSYSSAMDADCQAIGGRGGRSGGVPNYKNDILIEVVELYLPQGLEAWRVVALAYQRESMETVLRRGEDLRDNWNRKLCNRMQKPTGKPGVNTDRIFRCIEIERRIQEEAATAILGAESAESAHSRDDGESALSDVAAEDSFVGNDGVEEDEEVVAVNRSRYFVLVHSHCLHT